MLLLLSSLSPGRVCWSLEWAASKKHLKFPSDCIFDNDVSNPQTSPSLSAINTQQEASQKPTIWNNLTLAPSAILAADFSTKEGFKLCIPGKYQ